MGSIRNSANNTFRDYETDGLPSSGDHEPIKSEIRATFGTVEDEIETLRSGQTSGLLVYATWAELDAHPEAGVNTGASAKVFDDAGTHTDPVNATVGVANEGVYSFVESAGWERIANLEAEDARAWAEGTEPGGPGTRSAKEWAEDTTQSDLAERWASEAEDVEVEGGEFSSKHYAAKAAESAGALGGLAAVDALFATIPPKNKYNPALAEDGQIRNFSTGVKTANATSILSGKTPVTEGLTYTWSQRYPRTGFYPHIFAWNGATYLGALSSLPGSNVQFLQPTESGGVNNGHLQMTGTIPVGSNITHIETLLLYPYVAHDGATFDLIRNGVQLEIGDEVTDFEAYTTDSSRELSDEALPESALLARDAFTIRPGKNLYNKALAVDQSLYSFTNGNPSANTTAARSGKTWLPAGTYTASLSVDEGGFLANPHVWNNDNQYQGMGELQTTNAVVAGMNLVKRRFNGVGYRELTFTMPSDGFVGFSLMQPYRAGHTTGDFNAVINAFQIEPGAVATEYEPFGAGPLAILNDEALEPLPASSAAPEDDEVVIEFAGDLAYVRGRLGQSASLDVVHLLTRREAEAFSRNSVLNMDGAKSIPRATVANATALAYANAGTTLANQGDDTTPVKYNGSYMGGNGHGVAQMRTLGIPTGHGKTVEDEGSEYDNGAGVSFFIVRVFDEFTLWVLSENVGASEAAWAFNTTIGGTTLTHVAGGTNTGDIVFSTNTSSNWTPSTFNRTTTVRLDGEVIEWEDGVHVGRRLEIDDVFEISNPADALQWMAANAGSATPLYPTDPSIDGQVRTAITYRFAENGSLSVYHPLQVKQALALDIFGVVQASRITVPGGGSPQEFMPNTTGLTADFNAGVNVSGAAVPTNSVTPAKWADPDDPPAFMAQRALDGAAVPYWHFILGISPLSGVGVPDLRKTLISEAMFNGATGKMYVEAMSAGGSALPVPLPAGSYYEAVGFRIWGHADSTPEDAALFGWYYDGDDVGVVAHFTAANAAAVLTLPARFIGCTATLASGPNATLLSGRVTPDGLILNVAAPGGVIIRLTDAGRTT